MARRLASIPGYIAEGDVLGVDWAIAHGRLPRLVNDRGWPSPAGLRFALDGPVVIITDELRTPQPEVALLRPPSLVAGIHPAPDATSDDVEHLLIETLAEAGLARSSLFAIATADHTANDRSLRRLGYPLRSYPSSRLDRVRVPHPSETIRTLVGTRSVCEASALLCAGHKSKLVVTKRRSPSGTIAIARRHPEQDLLIDVAAMRPHATSHGAPVRHDHSHAGGSGNVVADQ